MKTFKVVVNGKFCGYVFGEDIHHAVANAKWSVGYFVTHEHLTEINYKSKN